LENDNYKLYFDRTVLTDIHIQHNRPDIIILNKQQKQAYLLDIAVPNSHNITQTYTGCLIKNASTHNFFIYYPISMNKKTKDMVFHALQNSHKIYFLVLSSIANDSQLFFLWAYVVFLDSVW
jgi:hypothetical protein